MCFKRACSDFNVNDDDRMICIHFQTCGALNDSYSEMETEEAMDYDLFKRQAKAKI